MKFGQFWISCSNLRRSCSIAIKCERSQLGSNATWPGIDGPNDSAIRESRGEPNWAERSRTRLNTRNAVEGRLRASLGAKHRRRNGEQTKELWSWTPQGPRVVSFLVGVLNLVCTGHSTRGDRRVVSGDVTWLAVSAVAEERRQAMTWHALIGPAFARYPMTSQLAEARTCSGRCHRKSRRHQVPMSINLPCCSRLRTYINTRILGDWTAQICRYHSSFFFLSQQIMQYFFETRYG